MVPALCSAHDNYPYSCCGSMDCGKIISMVVLSNGDKVITILNRIGQTATATFPNGQFSQPPIDENDHACILNERPLCLFLNGGV